MPSTKFVDSDEELLAEPNNKILIERKRKRKREKVDLKKENEVDKVKALYASYDSANTSAINSFDVLPLSKATLNGLKEADFTEPTDIQRLSLWHSIVGKDVVGAAKTGSGKTLALIIPLLESLWRNRWTKFDGLGALIITPTRELAFQIFQVLNKVGAHHEFSAALLIGGTDVEFEKSRLAAINIIICTPGRLLQHMDENEHFSCDNLQMLVIDEADRILDMGFRKQMDAIIENLPAHRQTLLFSATQTRKVEDLVRVSLHDPVFISAHENSLTATPDNLTQSYFVCEEEDKINMLWSFLRNRLLELFYSKLIRLLNINTIPVIKYHKFWELHLSNQINAMYRQCHYSLIPPHPFLVPPQFWDLSPPFFIGWALVLLHLHHQRNFGRWRRRQCNYSNIII